MVDVSDRRLATLTILVGALLLLSPTALGAVDLGAPTHAYGVGYVSVSDDGYEVSGAVPSRRGIDDRVLCWGRLSRSCHLERNLIGDDLRVTTGYQVWTDYPEYRFLVRDRTFYRVETAADRLWVEETPADAAVEELARPDGELPGAVQSALADGATEFESREELPTNRLFAVEGDRYATLSHRGSDRGVLDEALHRVEPALAPLGFLLGLALVLTGQAIRVRRRFARSRR